MYENIVLHVQLDGKKSDKEYVAEIVSMLKLEEKLNTLISAISGRQQQRGVIARVFLSTQKISVWSTINCAPAGN
ncbi:hypothetical protein [Clostridium estertheticum]|uniref:hypothetical protein n=1 Tax=Clostridium estertheticum TaxID=238834 RepID=UPI001CF17424|nr:hypothetical protein [Clostridium estertheticum]MCB2360987.1 hypothetical protein [Clostridium estertheticum]